MLIKQQISIVQYKDDLKNLLSKIEVAENELNQNKENLKQKLNNSGFTIKNEESTIRSGIEFEQMELSLLIDGEKEEYEYFITLQDDTLFEILVYEVGNGNYAKISSQLRTIVKNTKSIK